VTCKYCKNTATKTLVWLRDKNQRPARIKVPWCGCDLQLALKRFWGNPYKVVEGSDYEIEALPGDEEITKVLYIHTIGNNIFYSVIAAEDVPKAMEILSSALTRIHREDILDETVCGQLSEVKTDLKGPKMLQLTVNGIPQIL
jgi:trehalose/maltose hydrolase-like predicted phosphorylase